MEITEKDKKKVVRKDYRGRHNDWPFYTEVYRAWLELMSVPGASKVAANWTIVEKSGGRIKTEQAVRYIVRRVEKALADGEITLEGGWKK